MEKQRVVRVTKDEFELSDGSIHPMMFDLEKSEVPTIKEFQKIYDGWFEVFQGLGLESDDEQEAGGGR